MNTPTLYRVVKASDRLPEIYPVNSTHEIHFELDGRKVDGFFLHSRCFEYFDNSISGYRTIEHEEFGRLEWLEPIQSFLDIGKAASDFDSFFITQERFDHGVSVHDFLTDFAKSIIQVGKK